MNTPTKKTSAIDVLRYWMVERENIRRRRAAGMPWPWTRDPILQTYRFCNVYRHYDTVTQHYVQWVPAVNYRYVNTKMVQLHLFNAAVYRYFNWPDTMDAIGWQGAWERRRVEPLLKRRRAAKLQVFNHAYMISSARSARPKYIFACDIFDRLWANSWTLAEKIEANPTLQVITEQMSSQWFFGAFLGYEVACDLGTVLFPDAPDRATWANPGPGAVRGINRLLGLPLNRKRQTEDMAVEYMRDELMPNARGWFKAEFGISYEPLMMREIEHSLCEFDKYSRALHGQGTPKGKYHRKGE